MASSKTGQLSQAFLDNANTIPHTSVYTKNRGNKSSIFINTRNKRTPKGAALHNVIVPGTPVAIRSPLFVSSTDKSKGRRLEV